MDNDKLVKVEFIESYIKHGNGDYQWNDNHGELIRCKDCKHARIYENCVKCENAGNPGMFATYHRFNWFCADGERKDNA